MSTSTAPENEPSPYPAIRRVVTGHTDAGHSTLESVEEVKPYFFRGGKSLFTDLFWEDDKRPDLSRPFQDITTNHPNELCSKEGFVLKVVDTPPNSKSAFHRTETLDFGIVMKGQATLYLDNGEKQVCGPGDVVVQRSTIHAWHNETDEWSRVYFFMMATPPVKVGDKELKEEFRPPLA